LPVALTVNPRSVQVNIQRPEPDLTRHRQRPGRRGRPDGAGGGGQIAAGGAAAIPPAPYYAGLAEVLTRAFGVPIVVAEALQPVNGIAAAYIYGSWAARHEGQTGQRPVGDIDVLILGEPDRDQLYVALSGAEERLGRPVQATIRNTNWLETGSGAFHDTVVSRPLLGLSLQPG